MNFARLSMSYEYLHSPKSWLHFRSSKMKFYTAVIQLTCMPFISLTYMSLFFMTLLYLCRSMNMPKYLNRYFRKSIILFTFFLIISIKSNDQCASQELSSRYILQICPFNDFRVVSITTANQLAESYFYLPISIIRLTAMHLIYLISIKLLILTTSHQIIMRTMLEKWRSCRNSSRIKLIFTIMLSSQFLTIIFEQFEAMKISWSIRSIGLSQLGIFQENSIMVISFLNQMLINTADSIYVIANTLYSRDLDYENLSI